MRPCNRAPDEPERLKLLGPDDVAALLRDAVHDDLHEGELVLGLDWAAHLCGIASRFPERDGPIPELTADHLCLIAEELHAIELVLVTFVEPLRIAPTPADVARFEGLRVECEAAHVGLVDHLLMAGRRWRSISALTPKVARRPDSASGDHAA